MRSLLSLTGVQTISKLSDYWRSHHCIFRILDREESMSIAEKNGFPQDRLVYYEADGHISDLLKQYGCGAILTKESGDSGKFLEKTEDAMKAGVIVFVVKRPPMPKGFITVTGEYGLRNAVEKLLPGLFELRSGFTTGTCATDGATITAAVSLANHCSVRFFGGEGIGTVTLPGTGLDIGEPAINPVAIPLRL